MGDFNSWIGGEIHFIDTIDRNTIKRRLINIEYTANEHGRSLLDFLCDNSL